MTDTEVYLNEVYYCELRKKGLEADWEKVIRSKQAHYDRHFGETDYNRIKSKHPSTWSTTEINAIMIADHYQPVLNRLEREMSIEQDKIDTIRNVVRKAGLTGKEMMYVEYRYFNNYSVEKTEFEMVITNSKRMRNEILRKVEKVL